MLSDDGQAIALVCSNIAGPGGPKVLSAREWTQLARAIHGSPLERPRALLGMRSAEISDALGISHESAERLHALLARGGQMAFELERLAARGIWVVTRADDDYPVMVRRRLKEQAPPVLFGAGARALLATPALAVVGSRDADAGALAFARDLGALAASRQMCIVSGGARGVDSAAMEGAVASGGRAVGFTVDPLERLVRRKDARSALEDGLLVLATPFHPNARWHAGNAMRRNRLIYAQALAGIVVATSAGKGGTWTGAVENLKHRWAPLWVLDDGTAGARSLVAEGARPLSGAAPLLLDVDALVEEEPTLLTAAGDGSPKTSAGSARAEPEALGPPPPSGEDDPARDDVFAVVWSVIEPFLREPRNAQDLAGQFDLELSQARAWLARGVEEGLLTIRNRPKRFVSVAAADQPRLFATDR